MVSVKKKNHAKVCLKGIFTADSIPPPNAYGLNRRSLKFSQKNIVFWEKLLPPAHELTVKHSTCSAIRRHWVSCTSVWCWGYACRHMKTWFPWSEGVTLLLQLKLHKILHSDRIFFFYHLESATKGKTWKQKVLFLLVWYRFGLMYMEQCKL